MSFINKFLFFLFPDAPTSEAVKRKVESSVEGVEESAETPEKKSKLADENIATVEAEATA